MHDTTVKISWVTDVVNGLEVDRQHIEDFVLLWYEVALLA
jgi:hypothetical protein